MKKTMEKKILLFTTLCLWLRPLSRFDTAMNVVTAMTPGENHLRMLRIEKLLADKHR
jgi:hypothetical protein